MKGYKVFKIDAGGHLYCKPPSGPRHYYEVGESYEIPKFPVLCKEGFHYYTNVADLWNYYSFDPTGENRAVCEIEALGEIVTGDGDSKHATNKILVGKRLEWDEVLRLGGITPESGNTGWGNSGSRNSGDWNSGDRNSGSRNSGDWNSGDWNSGYGNSGDGNSGDGNSGNRNSGDGNSGNRNSGDGNSGYGNSGYGNSGNRNSGDGNSGDGNSTNHSAGIFNTTPDPLRIFNQPTDWTMEDWYNSDAYSIMDRLSLNTWRPWSKMSRGERNANPGAEATGGYLKTLGYKEAWAKLWGELNADERAAFTSLPNFDAAVFEEITGINIDA